MWREIEDRMDRATVKVAASDCSGFATNYQKVSNLVRGIESDIERLADDLNRTVDSYLSSVIETYNYEHVVQCPRDIYTLIPSMYDFVKSILDCKEIPPRSQSRIQKVYKAVTSTRKVKKSFQWYAKLREDIQWLLTSDRWPELSETDSEISVGNFTLINQTDHDPAASVKTLQKAAAAIKASNVPGLAKTLYGNVFLVTSIVGNRNVMALYYPSDDKVFLLLAKRFNEEQERVLIHELGHRYWKKFAAEGAKDAWKQYHRSFDAKGKLEIGDPVPQSDYVITGREPLGLRVVNSKGKSEIMSFKQIVQIEREMAYPTPYSAKSYEEHFCESLSLYVLGKLKSPHVEVFERIWL